MYLLTATVKQARYVKFDEDFTANIEISMKGPHGYLSATNWPLLHVINFNKLHCTMHTNTILFKFNILLVLWLYVFRLHIFWYNVVGFIIHAMEGFASNTILDWSCHSFR